MHKTLLAAVVSSAFTANAFCGFYVAGGGADLFNNATQVVLMRDGSRTVLSMQNNYQGPPEAFAMVIPVPIVLQKDNVKTLTKDIFARVDKLAAPRLVEYWERDPCEIRSDEGGTKRKGAYPMKPSSAGGNLERGVTVEAQFTVGEYEIVILSAKDALGLEAWLKDFKYRIPEGAAPLFRPYIQQGMKFFVAKVDPKKATFKDGMAQLSPLRFHYDSEKFELPIRLGLINAKDKQDPIIHILARNQRYEVANYPNATVPTNIDLVPSAKSEFGPFYVSLFDRTLKKNPNAVITEYAWQASTCDPCPTTPLQPADMEVLGADVLVKKNLPEEAQWNPKYQWVLTRLHARYDKTTAGEDLVFRAAKPLEGGREFDRDPTTPGALSQGSKETSFNNFQARYAIRYPWAGEVKCSTPVWGVWGARQGAPSSAQDTAFLSRDPDLVARLAEADVAAFDLKGKKAKSGVPLRAQAKR